MQYLADMGAEVIKIEPPKGAFERHWAGADTAGVGGVSALYLCANRNVKSLAIDLKHPEARDVLYRIIGESHVVAENFRPTVLDRLGYGYDAVRARKPDVIYASASGYGSTGPYAGRPGQDLLVQAMSGMAAAGMRDGEPVPVGFTVVDQHGAALMALAIAAAYARWLRSGEGTRIESTLLGAAIDLQQESIVTYLASGVGRDGIARDRHLASWFHAAPYGIYQTSDGHHVTVSLNDLSAVAEALDSDALRAFFGRNAYDERDALARVMVEDVARRTFADLVLSFDAKGVWHARVDDYEDLLANPQARHNQVFAEVSVNGDRATLVNHPIQYDGAVPPVRNLALAAGADTRAVLSDAGLSEGEIADLVGKRVVFAPEASQ